MAHWKPEPRYVERALLLGLPYGEHLHPTRGRDVNKFNLFMP
jgi:hypothetical protein